MYYLIISVLLFSMELIYFKVADKYNIIDKPNERSSHSSITLRGGGIIFYFGGLLYFLSAGFQYVWFFAGLTLITLISFADDLKSCSVKLRLTIHILAMLLMFSQWGLFSYPWYFIIICLALCAGILNAYNFMDGINGITGGYSLVLIVSLWYINNYQLTFVDNELLYFVGIALLVFNFFNFRPKAKCFAGDVGAMTIAFILVFLIGMLILKTGDFIYIILLVVYGIDTVLTIIHRLMLRENIFDAHRKHAYQIMANELKIPHIIVSLIYMLLQGMINVGCFFIQYARNGYEYIYLLISILVLIIIYICFMKKYFYLHIT